MNAKKVCYFWGSSKGTKRSTTNSYEPNHGAAGIQMNDLMASFWNYLRAWKVFPALTLETFSAILHNNCCPLNEYRCMPCGQIEDGWIEI